MRVYVPTYYKKFHCIAEKCKHNCCIGWDVEIDSESVAKYREMKDRLGARINKNIITEDGEYYFGMKENKKCPFLNQFGLCDIISELGENAVPYICRMHPRFKNVFSGREEIGLGLCCEEVARIIVDEKEPFSLTVMKDGEESVDDFESGIIDKRAEILDIFNDKTVGINHKIKQVAEKYSIEESVFCDKNSFEIFESLDYMDWKLPRTIDWLTADESSFASEIALPDDIDMGLSNIACYFIFRILSPAETDNEFRARLGVVLLSISCIAQTVKKLFRDADGCSVQMLSELSRIYSAEIEYSPQNMEILIGEFDILLNC